MDRFIPRHIPADQAAQGYNNEGRGELLGYIAVPAKHEETCRYRIATGGDPDKKPHETCTCRIGLWQDKAVAKTVAVPVKRPKAKAKAKAKPKARTKSKPIKKSRAKAKPKKKARR